jgi:putative hydrolase of the HAD superfamily
VKTDGATGATIRAFLLDLDGTIWDSEGVEHEAYRRLYEHHGHRLELERWQRCVGTIGSGYDPIGELEALAGPLDRVQVAELLDASFALLIPAEGLRPGVRSHVDAAVAAGLSLGVVSSSSRAWVEEHVERLLPDVTWDVIRTADGDPSRAKPNPVLYEEAAAALGVAPHEAIAVEDSAHGVTAARAAGVFCVAVPNDVTRGMDLSAADLVMDSLADAAFEDLLRAARGVRRSPGRPARA